jgi:CheY-like chemotaxis protein
VALSGYGLPEDRARAASAGFHHHLTKPVDVKLLLDALAP